MDTETFNDQDIKLGKKKQATNEAPVPSQSANEMEGDKLSWAIPDRIKQKYVQVKNTFYFDNQKTVAFEDKGQKLQTKQLSHDVIESLLDIAEARGWTKIKVKGDERFKRSVWMEAVRRGMAVEGFKPSALDRANAEKRMKDPLLENTAPPKDAFAIKPLSSSSKSAFSGKLMDHGAAPFEFKKENDLNYFVKLKNEQNNEKVIWSADLKRALAESGAQIGDQIELEQLGRKPVTLNRPVKDKTGKITGTETIKTHRNEWEIRAQSIRTDKPEEIAKKHPELVNEIAAVKIAEKFSERIEDKDSRGQFMQRVRETIAVKIEKGEVMVDIQVADKSLKKNLDHTSVKIRLDELER